MSYRIDDSANLFLIQSTPDAQAKSKKLENYT